MKTKYFISWMILFLISPIFNILLIANETISVDVGLFISS